MVGKNLYARLSYSFSPEKEVGLRGVLFFSDVIKRFFFPKPIPTEMDFT